MYLPPHFEESRIEVLHALMRARPFATLVTLSTAGLAADHIPLLLCTADDGQATLRGHLARANPMWRERVEDAEALAIFNGPQAYVSPSWYASKREHGKVVPTWNYIVVQVRGPMRVVHDAKWLKDLLVALTDRHEAQRPQPWALADAPADYTDKLLEAIVGVEIAIGSICGKWKLSQNQTERNRAGVLAGLRADGSEDALQLAALLAEASRDAR